MSLFEYKCSHKSDIREAFTTECTQGYSPTWSHRNTLKETLYFRPYVSSYIIPSHHKERPSQCPQWLAKTSSVPLHIQKMKHLQGPSKKMSERHEPPHKVGRVWRPGLVNHNNTDTHAFLCTWFHFSTAVRKHSNWFSHLVEHADIFWEGCVYKKKKKGMPTSILCNMIIELLCECISHLPSSCVHCCSFTPNGTASEPALKQASSSFVSRPRGNEGGELDVLSNYGKDKKPVRFPCQGPSPAAPRGAAFTHKSEAGYRSAAD